MADQTESDLEDLRHDDMETYDDIESFEELEVAADVDKVSMPLSNIFAMLPFKTVPRNLCIITFGLSLGLYVHVRASFG